MKIAHVWGAMARDLTFTLYLSVHDKNAQPFTQSWDDWIEIFSKHDIRKSRGDDLKSLESAKDGPCLVLGLIPEGLSHLNKNVKEVHAIGLDIEEHTEDEILAALEKISEFEYIVYSTHKHGSAVVNGPRIRVILPLKDPIPPEEHARVWQGINKLTNRISDQKTKNVGRVFYTPSSWSEKFIEFHRNKSDKWISADCFKKLTTTNKLSSDIDKEVRRIKGSLRRMGKDEDIKDAAVAVLKGQPFAEDGSRHDMGLQLTMWIANKVGEVSDGAIEEVFVDSIEVMQALDPNSPGMNDILTGYRGALSKKEEENYNKQLNGEEPYSDEELKRIANGQKCSLSDLEKRWIIQKGKSYFILTEKSHYFHFEHSEARPAAVQFLKRSPVQLFSMTKNGYRRRTIEELVEEYGTVASEIIGDLTIQKSWFNPDTNTIHEAVKPLRTDLTPVFHQKIDDYFKIMTERHYDRFCDWLACFPDLDRLLCAIYIVGPRNVFKTGLATGLSKLWNAKGTPTPIKTILRSFNENLVLMSPLVIADESVPKEWNGNSITAELREMISITSRPLNRKYLSSSLLFGSIRLILCANNEFLLQSEKTVPNPEDLEATAERFLYLKVPELAQEWKEKHITPDEAKFWVEGGGFAEHCLWLSKNRDVIPASRFWVEGDITEMHSLLLSGSEFNARVNYWLVQYLMNPQPIDNICQQNGFVRIVNKQFLVNDQALIDYWEIYNKTRVEPSPGKIGVALRSVSEKGWKQLRWTKDIRIRYRVINLHNLFAWAEEHGYGNKIQMMETINRKEQSEMPNVRPIPIGEERRKLLARRIGRAVVKDNE